MVAPSMRVVSSVTPQAAAPNCVWSALHWAGAAGCVVVVGAAGALLVEVEASTVVVVATTVVEVDGSSVVVVVTRVVDVGKVDEDDVVVVDVVVVVSGTEVVVVEGGSVVDVVGGNDEVLVVGGSDVVVGGNVVVVVGGSDVVVVGGSEVVVVLGGTQAGPQQLSAGFATWLAAGTIWPADDTMLMMPGWSRYSRRFSKPARNAPAITRLERACTTLTPWSPVVARTEPAWTSTAHASRSIVPPICSSAGRPSRVAALRSAVPVRRTVPPRREAGDLDRPAGPAARRIECRAHGDVATVGPDGDRVAPGAVLALRAGEDLAEEGDVPDRLDLEVSSRAARSALDVERAGDRQVAGGIDGDRRAVAAAERRLVAAVVLALASSLDGGGHLHVAARDVDLAAVAASQRRVDVDQRSRLDVDVAQGVDAERATVAAVELQLRVDGHGAGERRDVDVATEALQAAADVDARAGPVEQDVALRLDGDVAAHVESARPRGAQRPAHHDWPVTPEVQDTAIAARARGDPRSGLHRDPRGGRRGDQIHARGAPTLGEDLGAALQRDAVRLDRDDARVRDGDRLVGLYQKGSGAQIGHEAGWQRAVRRDDARAGAGGAEGGRCIGTGAHRRMNGGGAADDEEQESDRRREESGQVHAVRGRYARGVDVVARSFRVSRREPSHMP